MDFHINKTLEILERTPGMLKVWLSGLDPAWINNNEGPETFSPFDVLGHLLHGERSDWITRARIILAEQKNKTFESFDRFAQFNESKGKSFSDLLDEFEKARTQNLKELRSFQLQDADFLKTGVHPVFGTVTLKELLATWAAHDLAHIAQIARVMAKQYKSAIGPWREYMGIMDR